MEDMKVWIFKIIWIPILGMLSLCSMVLLTYMLKEVSWDAPMRWLGIIGLIAYLADWWVNR